MAPDKAQDSLNGTIDAAVALLSTLHASTLSISKSTNVASSTPSEPSTQIDALALALDCATLIRAHATKLSLLIINEPFTPTAIEPILKEVIAKPAPALLGAAQACDAERYTGVVRRELGWRCSAVLKELVILVGKIPRDGKVIPPSQRQGIGGAQKTATGSITATGILWEACDEVVRLADGGVAAVLARKVGEWRDTMRDVMEELKEWSEEEEDEGYADDDDDDDDDDALDDGDGEDEGGKSAQDMIDKLMASAKVIPRDDPDKLRPRLEATIKNLRLTTHFYQAVAKRRLPFVSADMTPSSAKRLGEGLAALERIPAVWEELAGAFYELDVQEITRLAGQCEKDALGAASLWDRTWEGGEDAFTEWVKKYRTEISGKE